MRLWLIPSADLSLHDQIVRQISLGVLSGELAPGERLPSVRTVARRFHIHPNTVSAAYRELAAGRWVQSRHGSGVYVREAVRAPPADHALLPETTDAVEELLQQLTSLMRQNCLSPKAVADRLTLLMQMEAEQRVVLVEPDAELARIVQFEIEAATGFRIPHLLLGASDFPTELVRLANRAMVAVLPSKTAAARAAVRSETDVLPLRIRPIAAALAAALPTGRDYLVAVVSRWQQFLDIAGDMLIAAGFAKDALILRKPQEPDWRAGLDQAAAVLTDSACALELPLGVDSIVFPLLAEESLACFRRCGLPQPALQTLPVTTEHGAGL